MFFARDAMHKRGLCRHAVSVTVCRACHVRELRQQEVKVIRQKAPHGGPILRLGVTQGVEICTIEFLG